MRYAVRIVVLRWGVSLSRFLRFLKNVLNFAKKNLHNKNILVNFAPLKRK